MKRRCRDGTMASSVARRCTQYVASGRTVLILKLRSMRILRCVEHPMWVVIAKKEIAQSHERRRVWWPNEQRTAGTGLEQSRRAEE